MVPLSNPIGKGFQVAEGVSIRTRSQEQGQRYLIKDTTVYDMI